MTDEALPSISTGVVGSRFVSQSDIEAARTRRDEQWKAAYARFLGLSLSHTSDFLSQSLSFTFRLGQAPPPAPQEDAFDGRSLAEVRSYLRHHAMHHHVHLMLLETRRQSRKSRTMAKRRASFHALSYPSGRTLGSQTRGMGREE